MKFKKQDKEIVVGWIERQFKKNPTFPVSCIDGDNKNSVSKEHLKSYKAWTKTTHKRSEIQEWIEKWLDASEVKTLEAEIKRRSKDKKE
ncbi:hypothetical protein [Pontibacterium sp.]|uniref:hypothetical protein n=1 Tax=Pontibacterium sp. TaxID=2036026 RepID=UPI00356676F3